MNHPLKPILNPLSSILSLLSSILNPRSSILNLPSSLFSARFSLLLLIAGLAAYALLPTAAQDGALTYLPFVARDASPASWPRVPPAGPSPTPEPGPTATLAPASLAVISSSSFTETIGAETFLFIVGEVGNAGPTTTVRDLTVIAALLDERRELLRHASEPAYQTVLGPGETTPFRIMVSLPARYASHDLYLDYRLTADRPPPAVSPSARNTYVDEVSGWHYFLGEVVNTSDVNMAGVQAVVVLYDASGDILNVADSGRGAGSLFEDVIGVGQKRPFRIVLRHGPRAYASLRWRIAYREADRPAPGSLALAVGYVARRSGTLRDETGEVVGATEWFDIYGEVENTTAGSIRAVRAYAAFYGDGGEVMNAGLVQSLHGRLGRVAPGERTPFHLTISAGLIPDVDTPRALGVTYEPADDGWPEQIAITTERAYRETRSVAGVPVEWLNAVGEVRNDGADAVQDVRVIATFYDEAGQVVNAAAGEAFQSVLPAGTTSPFKIRTASGLLAYDHYVLVVTAQPARGSAASELVLSHQGPAPGAMPAIFQGEVTNGSAGLARGVTVFAALFHAGGQILVVESLAVADMLPAGASVPFTLRVEQGAAGWQTYAIGAASD